MTQQRHIIRLTISVETATLRTMRKALRTVAIVGDVIAMIVTGITAKVVRRALEFLRVRDEDRIRLRAVTRTAREWAGVLVQGLAVKICCSSVVNRL